MGGIRGALELIRSQAEMVRQTQVTVPDSLLVRMSTSTRLVA